MKKKQELGIYVHIPFCEKKCDYCDFLSGPANNKTKDNYIRAILNEIKSYKELMQEYLVKTIFIGGGTPSSIQAEYIAKTLEAIKKSFIVQAEEVTIEVNPSSITRDKLLTYKEYGVNRLSIGLQSANNEELKLLGRIHTYEEFLENYKLARIIGYDNINIDLISGLPEQGVENWENTLRKVTELSPEHISAYSLIIEEGTPLYDKYKQNEQNEENDRLIYKKTKEILEAKAYSRYEISNYAKKGYESKHNNLYWKRKPYLGIGLGSSSLINNRRFRKEEDLSKYIENSKNHDLLEKDIKKISQKEAMEEFMFLGLRIIEGIKKSQFKEEFNISIEDVYASVIEQSIKEGVIEENDGRIFLTDYGLDVSNYVMARFLLD